MTFFLGPDVSMAISPGCHDEIQINSQFKQGKLCWIKDGWMACLETNYDQDTEAEPTSNTIDFEVCDRNENSPAKNIKLSSRQSEE